MKHLAVITTCLLALGSGAPLLAHAQATLTDGGMMFSVPVTSMKDIPFRTVVRQQYDYSCGSAALATLLHYHYNLPVSEAEVFKAMYARGDQEKIRKVGFSLLDIKNYLASRGFQADGYKLTFEQLVKINRPAIAVVTAGAYRHFVVVKGARNGKVLIGDPAGGLRTYTNAEFSQIWNGVIFAIHASSGVDAPYNRDEEWSPWALAPLGQPMGDASLSSFTRELPPIYQITSMINGNPPTTP